LADKAFAVKLAGGVAPAITQASIQPAAISAGAEEGN
jgi:hypothetical protein